jgi:hypothetical protein
MLGDTKEKPGEWSMKDGIGANDTDYSKWAEGPMEPTTCSVALLRAPTARSSWKIDAGVLSESQMSL